MLPLGGKPYSKKMMPLTIQNIFRIIAERFDILRVKHVIIVFLGGVAGDEHYTEDREVTGHRSYPDLRRSGAYVSYV